MEKTAKIEVQKLPIGKISANPKNPKRHWDIGIESSIKDLSYIAPIIVDEKFMLLAGEGRWRALKKLGYQEIDVIVKRGLTPRQKERYVLADNKISEHGGWDEEMLATMDREILEMAGFADQEIAALMQNVDVQEDAFDADAEAAKITKPVTKLGDVIQLGDHRLICADATDPKAWEKLMGKEKAGLIFTDPPYNVGYNYDKYEAIKCGRKKKFKGGGRIFNDKKKPQEFYNMLLAAFKQCYAFSRDDASVYCCYATKTQAQFFDALRDAGFHFSQSIIWLKERIIPALGQDYHRIYEPIFFGWKEGKKHFSNHNITTWSEFWTLDRQTFEEQMDAWYINRDKSCDYEHPTQKPVRLPERAIKKSSRIGDIVLDPFLGSGSTMIACEQLKRRCYGIELDPTYVDVEILRYEKFTGKTISRP